MRKCDVITRSTAMSPAWVASLLLVQIAASASVSVPAPRWPPYSNNAVLNENVFLFWTANRTTNEITIEVQARATGHVGFGFGTGNGMAGADIVVGGVKNGTGYVQDRHGIQNGIVPTLDAQQDWKLLNAEEKDNVTSLRYSRLFDTGDCANDITITADTMSIIWSFHPTSDTLQYHGLVNRGQLRLQVDVVQLLGTDTQRD